MPACGNFAKRDMHLFRLMQDRRFNSSLRWILPGLLVLAVLFAGWFATDYLGNQARQEIIGEGQASILTVSTYVASSLNNLEGAVKTLAGSPWIAPALMSKGDQDIERAHSALDRYNSALHASVSYLLDADGMTVASSNRNDPDSFVGKSYRFRPYFQEAAQGRTGHYFALGITSGKKGFYASYPVQNSMGKVIGVVTMKKDLDEMELFFSRFPLCFLVNPDGIIFLSSSPAMVLKSLWPLDNTIRDTLIASQQFGNKLPEPGFLKKEIVDGTEVTFEGKDYFVSRRVIDTDRWSIVLLTPTDQIKLYRWAGILATISVSLLIMVFSGIIYVIDRSKEAIRQSEESKRLLLHAAGEGIFGVDATGRLTFVNPSTLRMLGFAEEEMLGQRVHALIHHSHEDGSNYPVEDCPMYASYANAAESHVANESLYRKDGSSFPVEYSSMPIICNRRITGAVVTFRDITEHKQAEQERDILAEIGRLIGSTLDIDEVYERFAAEARKLIPFDNLMINLINQRENALVIAYLSGIDIPKRRQGESIPFQGSFCESIARERKGMLLQLENKQEVIGQFPSLTHVLQAGLRSMMAIPLISRDKVIGALVFRSKEKDFYTEGLLNLAERIGAQIAGAIANAQLFTNLKRTENSLRESEGRFRGLVEKAAVGVAEIDMNTGSFCTVNRRLCEMVGRTEEELLATTFQAITHPEDLHLQEEKTRMMLAGKIGHYSLEKRYLRKDGGIVWVNITVSPLWKQGEAPGRNIAVVEDITDRKRMEEKIKQMAYHDALTGLPNRKLFSDRLSIALAQSQRNQKKVGIAMLDLDHFKSVNDTLGHAVGDLLLKATAERLSAALRKGDTVARFGGDEFVLILPDLGVKEDAIRVAQKIVDNFRKPFPIGTHQLAVTTSIGIAVYPADGTDEVTLMKNADIAMYQAKQAGRARYQLSEKA
jgi:diguanylate cyclase (GGDEF)-like protein/PAS domain S-box-containing protein